MASSECQTVNEVCTVRWKCLRNKIHYTYVGRTRIHSRRLNMVFVKGFVHILAKQSVWQMCNELHVCGRRRTMRSRKNFRKSMQFRWLDILELACSSSRSILKHRTMWQRYCNVSWEESHAAVHVFRGTGREYTRDAVTWETVVVTSWYMLIWWSVLASRAWAHVHPVHHDGYMGAYVGSTNELF